MMNTVLMVDDDLPWKRLIANFLNIHPNVQRIDWDSLEPITSSLQHFTHCFVYITHTPNEDLIYKLNENSSLFLIAEKEYDSQFFIKLDDFTADVAQASWKFIENFCNLVSTYQRECETPLISVDLNEQERKALIAEVFQGVSNIEKTDPATIKDLTERQQKALASWNSRENAKLAASKLNISERTYYRTLEKAKMLSGINSSGFSDNLYL